MNTPRRLHFSAVLLAGGRSTRMGRDKAWLEWEGQPLWRRQLATLQRLQPAELFLSGRRAVDFQAAGLPVLLDRQPGRGPLEGVARALEAARQPLVLVLAVDLPRMTSGLLRRLLARCSGSRGVVPQTPAGLEPLAAVYPKSALALAEATLRAGGRAMHQFVRRCLEAGLVKLVRCPARDAALFANWNRPHDVSPG